MLLANSQLGPNNEQDNDENERAYNIRALIFNANNRTNLLRQVKRDIILNILFFIILLIISLFSVKLDTEHCGREMLVWVLTYTTFYFCRVVHQVYFLFAIMRNYFVQSVFLAYARFFILNPFNVAWIIYGNVSFYYMSLDKDCEEEKSDYTQMSTFSLIILIIGYI